MPIALLSDFKVPLCFVLEFLSQKFILYPEIKIRCNFDQVEQILCFDFKAT